jgi:hypothetical protein
MTEWLAPGFAVVTGALALVVFVKFRKKGWVTKWRSHV